MAYDIFVKCDRAGCENTMRVPAVGNLPNGWIAMRFAKPRIVDGRASYEAASVMLCSWNCVMQFVKQQQVADDK